MKSKLIALGALVVALLGVIAFTTKQVDAYRGDYTQVGPNHTEEREAEMDAIFANPESSYDEWVALMTEDGRKPGVVDKISEEEFPAFAQAHKLAQEGDIEGANAIREDLGLGQGQRRGGGNGNGQGLMMRDGSCNR